MLDLATYAVISAEIAEGDRPMADVLAARGLSEAQWAEATVHWTSRMAEDARGGEPRLALAFSEAFAKAQDDLRAVVDLSPAEWARLTLDVEIHGVARALATRGLRLSDYGRLVRAWAKRLATDRDAKTAYDRAREAGRSAR